MEVPSGVKLIIGEKSKSYSPVSLPKENSYMDLLVKPYPPTEGDHPPHTRTTIPPSSLGTARVLARSRVRTTALPVGFFCLAGGGFGALLCNLKVGERALMKLKPARKIHGATTVVGQYDWVGLVGGGTGIAPLVQIAKAELKIERSRSQIRLLAVNRGSEDSLLREEIVDMAVNSGGRLRVTFFDTALEGGRGDVALAQEALLDDNTPDAAEANSGSFGGGKRMVYVCGSDGFVAHWAGSVLKDENKKKIQGPLEGLLAEAGLTEAEVYKF